MSVLVIESEGSVNLWCVSDKVQMYCVKCLDAENLTYKKTMKERFLVQSLLIVVMINIYLAAENLAYNVRDYKRLVVK